MILDTFANPNPNDLNIQFHRVRGSPVSGTPEISAADCASTVQRPAEPMMPACIDSITQERFDMAVNACRDVNTSANYFRDRKTKLVEALDAAYTVYDVVKLNPALEDQLYKIDLLQDRTRKLSRNKLVLACVYCALQPKNEDDFKACSDYTAFLLEAEAKETSADDFVEWAKPLTLKDCLKAVRQRKRDGSTGDQDRPPRATADLRLSITRTAKGVRGSMDGRTFRLTQATLDAIVGLIKTTSPGAPDAGGEPHALR